MSIKCNHLIYLLRKPAAILIALLALFLQSCASSGLNIAKQKPKFIAPPEIFIAPHADTPMVRMLKFTTDVPVRVSVDVYVEGKNWSIDFEQYDTEHNLPLLGFLANKDHTLTVNVFNLADEKSSFDRPLNVTTPGLPNWFPSIKASGDTAKMEPGFTLFNVIPEGENTEFGALLVVVDELGRVVWYQRGKKFSDVRKLPNGNLFSIQGKRIVEADMLGRRVREWEAIGNSKQRVEGYAVETLSFHHEAYPMENGHILALSIEARSYDNYWSSDNDASAPKEKALLAGDVVVEFTREGKIVNQWPLLDLLDPYRIAYGSLLPYWDSFFKEKTRDWSHANAVIYDASDDTIIVSVRHQDATIKFSRKTGKLIWILGPHDNWDQEKYAKFLLKPANEVKHFFPFHEHAPMLLPNGNLLIYDNGSYRSSPFEPPMPPAQLFSRAVEYAIDVTTKQAKIVWEYGEFSEKKYYAGALGDVDWLPKTGNVLITHGNLPDEDGKLSARIIEVTHDNPATTVFQLHVFDKSESKTRGWRIYRAERMQSLYQ
ncbi:MAG: aryl-sulfate sulfotransferase [Thiohalomonadales bacterium]